MLREATAPGTSLAVVAAGNVSYFAHRPTEDLLGKNDPVIARMPPRDEFLPGHDRWDYEYTVGRLKPDILVTLWSPTLDDYRYIHGLGYRDVGSMVDDSGRNYCFESVGGMELSCRCQDGSYPHGVICGLLVNEESGRVDVNSIIREWVGPDER